MHIEPAPLRRVGLATFIHGWIKNHVRPLALVKQLLCLVRDRTKGVLSGLAQKKRIMNKEGRGVQL